ncbi:Transcriptional repressor NrdR [Stieleria bergensis]|uniref:Transcriptional repressor NrdR n=1 Tax=Stieleria bergensis TaxID=2528025 RepID=A0A517SRK7_9BACT|nr:MAG: transcriptional regulator NrdR [Rhodopirellula sp. TMED11]QDT58762.1 Transcriptional repressor NrdR [Planctomycetes bacterium SV_7m_r]
MRCPFCHCDRDRVLDTRTAEGGYAIRRKRMCNECSRKFVTVETIEQTTMRVVKRDGTREAMDREKIRCGIERACSKRNVDSDAIEATVQRIETQIYNEHENEIPAKELGEIVMTHLAALDEVAYIRFASVYQVFQSADEFIREVSRLTNRQHSK